MFCFNRKHRVRDESPPAAWTREANFEQNANALPLPNPDPYYMPTLLDPSLAAGDSTNGHVSWTIGSASSYGDTHEYDYNDTYNLMHYQRGQSNPYDPLAGNSLETSPLFYTEPSASQPDYTSAWNEDKEEEEEDRTPRTLVSQPQQQGRGLVRYRHQNLELCGRDDDGVDNYRNPYEMTLCNMNSDTPDSTPMNLPTAILVQDYNNHDDSVGAPYGGGYDDYWRPSCPYLNTNNDYMPPPILNLNRMCGFQSRVDIANSDDEEEN